MGVLDKWNLSYEEVDELLTGNPSLQGMFLGYAAEVKLRSAWLTDDRIQSVRQPDPHDRTDQGDFVIAYKDVELIVEVKSLQTRTVKKTDDGLAARFQCDASDRRTVHLPTGEDLETTCLLVGEFDVLAVNLFAFTEDWVFAFAKNWDLPRSKYRGYSEEAREHLLASGMPITWPLQPPYKEDLFAVLDDLVDEKNRGVAPDIQEEGIVVEDD